MKRMRLLHLAALAAATTLAGTAVTQADTFKIKIGSGHPIASVWIGAVKDFMIPKITERVAKETGHKIEWTEAFGGSVCKLGECLEAMEAGLLDMGDAHISFEPAKLMAHNFAFFAPFGTPDPRVGAKAVAKTYETTPALRKALEDRYNQVYIGAGQVGNYGLVTTFTWNTVPDMKGHKVAAAGPNLPWLSGTGVVGVQSTLNDAFTSMQTGVYEGWVMFPDAIVSFKLDEVAKQYVDMDFGCVPTPLITMNKDTWKGLSANVQKIFLDVGREYGEHMGELTYAKQEAGKKAMRDRGLVVRQASMADKQAWAKSLPNIPKQRFEEINKAGLPGEAVYSYIKALKSFGHTFPRDWEAER